jgi:hypothetical protein
LELILKGKIMKFKYYNMLAGLLLLTSCSKELTEVDSPTFDVTALTTTVKVGDIVNFKVTGDADIVSFFSGEPTKEFANRDGRIIDATGAGVTLSFTSLSTGGGQGTLSATVPPQLTVLASTTFNGNYDFASVNSAVWTDITSRFKYFATGAAFVTSTEADLSDIVVPGKPLYIAYRYETQPQTTTTQARQWQIEAFTMTTKKNIGTSTIQVKPVLVNSVNAGGFRLLDQNPVTAPARSTLTISRITLFGNLFDPVNDPGNNPLSVNWAVSKAIEVNKLEIAPDRAVGIKDLAKESTLTAHTYVYANAGTYKATFVASNHNIDSKKEVVKEITITVTP